MTQAPPRLKLLLHNIAKDLNAGNMLRTAHCLGCEEVVVMGNRKTHTRGTQGAKAWLPHRHFYGVDDGLAYARSQGFQIVGIEIGGKCLSTAVFDRNAAFLLGHEVNGLGTLADQCDVVYSVPQYGVLASMNVSSVAGMAMWEFRRQVLARWGPDRLPEGLRPQRTEGQHFMGIEGEDRSGAAGGNTGFKQAQPATHREDVNDTDTAREK